MKYQINVSSDQHDKLMALVSIEIKNCQSAYDSTNKCIEKYKKCGNTEAVKRNEEILLIFAKDLEAYKKLLHVLKGAVKNVYDWFKNANPGWYMRLIKN